MARALDGSIVVEVAQVGKTPAGADVPAFSVAQHQAIRFALVYGHVTSRSVPGTRGATPESTLRSLHAYGVLEPGALDEVYLLSRDLLARCVTKFRESSLETDLGARRIRGDVHDHGTFGVWWYTEERPRPKKEWAFAPRTVDGSAWRVEEAVAGFRLSAEAIAAGRKATCGLEPGDVLYLVREVDSPDHPLHTWRVAQERVRQVRLDGFTFERRVGFDCVHKHHALDTQFYRTPEAAVRSFTAEKREEIERAHRAIAEAERAIAWADARPVDGSAPTGAAGVMGPTGPTGTMPASTPKGTPRKS